MRIAVLASGSWTILQALIDAELPIALVLADRDCAALGRAERAGIATSLVARTTYGAGFDRDAAASLPPLVVEVVLPPLSLSDELQAAAPTARVRR